LPSFTPRLEGRVPEKEKSAIVIGAAIVAEFKDEMVELAETAGTNPK
jgi:hypothetical protein